MITKSTKLSTKLSVKDKTDFKCKKDVFIIANAQMKDATIITLRRQTCIVEKIKDQLTSETKTLIY